MTDNEFIDYEQLERLKSSPMLKNFVRKQNGEWNHAQWEGFLSEAKGSGYSLPAGVVGAALEDEKALYWKIRNGEVNASFSSNEPAVDDPITELEKEVSEKPTVAEETEAIVFDDLPLERRSIYMREMLRKRI
ncbi:MAG: hypothetical protein NT157_02700 [Candidatus Micrarchaeota archaeon]|nr:hypothetical protein [Candidatus Micrarchaeota archaeon]